MYASRQIKSTSLCQGMHVLGVVCRRERAQRDVTCRCMVGQPSMSPLYPTADYSLDWWTGLWTCALMRAEAVGHGLHGLQLVGVAAGLCLGQCLLCLPGLTARAARARDTQRQRVGANLPRCSESDPFRIWHAISHLSPFQSMNHQD